METKGGDLVRQRSVIHVGLRAEGMWSVLWNACQGEQHDGYSVFRREEATDG